MDAVTDLSGRVVAVTGASSGIGEATALACARTGAAVALAARRSERIEGLVRQIEDSGGQAIAVTTDVADEEQANAFIRAAHERFGRLDALIANAGVMLLGPIDGAPTEEWRRMVNVNVMGVLYCTHAALPLIKAAGGGDVVIVSSVGGRVVGRYSGVYSLTKFGIGAFAEALRAESIGSGVRVTLIEPGRVDTELRTHVREEVMRELSGGFAGVEPMSSEQVADAILFAIGQPPGVTISEVLMRPANSPM
jgi:NADP-dependent 3-hydroxy acid dehydrogenase YdfG